MCTDTNVDTITPIHTYTLTHLICLPRAQHTPCTVTTHTLTQKLNTSPGTNWIIAGTQTPANAGAADLFECQIVHRRSPIQIVTLLRCNCGCFTLYLCYMKNKTYISIMCETNRRRWGCGVVHADQAYACALRTAAIRCAAACSCASASGPVSGCDRADS